MGGRNGGFCEGIGRSRSVAGTGGGGVDGGVGGGGAGVDGGSGYCSCDGGRMALDLLFICFWISLLTSGLGKLLLCRCSCIIVFCCCKLLLFESVITR